MSQKQPKYMVLVNQIKKQVHENQLHYGDKIYSENELSAMFGMSRQTVRHAVDILEQEKIVERRHGSGTYVIYNTAAKPVPTNTIGIISTYLDGYIFPSIIDGIDSVLAQNGYTMQLTLTRNQVENETRALSSLLEKNVDGIIVEPTKSGLPNPNTTIYEEIRRRGIPLIFFNAYYPGMNFPHVCLDDRECGRMAAQHLIDAGHRTIAGMFQSDDLQGHLRYSGFVNALTQAGIEVRSANILWFSTEDIPYLSEDFARIRRAIANCTALVCYNDQVAFLVVSELRKHGIGIPEDLSIISIDDSELSSLCEVPLTSLRHPMEKLGQTAAENMLHLIKSPDFVATTEFPPQLVRRASVKQVIPR